jgi:hypothetical protein
MQRIGNAMEKFVNSYELARYYDDRGRLTKVTANDYKGWELQKDQNSIANFVFYRLHSRYIKPFQFKDSKYRKEFKNGFSLMASCCLLVETLQSFKNGWGDSRNNSRNAFTQFFNSDNNFPELRNRGGDVFEDIRCGILHQGETKNGWSITRGGKVLLNAKQIDATIFLHRLEKSLKEYVRLLKTDSWESRTWIKFRKKMSTVISNCNAK